MQYQQQLASLMNKQIQWITQFEIPPYLINQHFIQNLLPDCLLVQNLFKMTLQQAKQLFINTNNTKNSKHPQIKIKSRD